MKERQRRIAIKGPIPYYVYVIQSEDVCASRTKRNHLLGYLEPLGCAAALHTGMKDEPASYIFLDLDPEPNEIVHEVVHCVWRIMELIGARHEEEIMAYFIGYISEKVMEVAYEPRAETVDNQPGEEETKAQQRHKGKQQRKGSILPVVLPDVPSTA